MKVESSAAVATLTVPAAVLENDGALKYVVALASDKQLTVKATKGKKPEFHLEFVGGLVMTHRNAILRHLVGPGLCYALDEQKYALLGGYKGRPASPSAAMVVAGITSWMSFADSLSKNEDEKQLNSLNEYLASRSFLVNSHRPTLADVDVAFKIATFFKPMIANYPNVHRWMTTCVATIAMDTGLSFPALQDIPPVQTAATTPVFFYGTESNATLPAKTTAQAAAPGGSKKATGAKPANQGGKATKKEKKAKAPAPAPAAAAPAAWDVSALDIRVGKIVKVWPHPEAEKLYCEEIDVGEDSPRQIASGLRPFYPDVKDLQDRRVVVLCNLKARNLVGFKSHGMVLCASNSDHTSVECMEPPEGAAIGERVVFEGFDGKDAEPENKVAKKKIFEAVSPDLKTNDKGVCVWKDAVSKTSGGPIKASKGMPHAQVS